MYIYFLKIASTIKNKYIVQKVSILCHNDMFFLVHRCYEGRYNYKINFLNDSDHLQMHFSAVPATFISA